MTTADTDTVVLDPVVAVATQEQAIVPQTSTPARLDLDADKDAKDAQLQAKQRKQHRRELLREDLTPATWRTEWAQGLVAAFETAHETLTASRQTAHLLHAATHGEKGLVAQVRLAINEAVRVADQKITRTTSTRLADFESTLAGQAAAAQQQVADALTELNAQAQAARDQRIEAEQLVLALRDLHLLLKKETLALRAERELLQKAKTKKSFFSSIFGG